MAYRRNYSSDAGADAVKDCSGHGTNVASIATGYNDGAGAPALEDSANGFNHGLGVAPFALVGASKIFNCAGGFAGGWTPATLAGNAYGDSARISNNSWGTSGLAFWGSYSTRAQQYDAVVRDARTADAGNQNYVTVFAAGNDGDGNPDSGGLPDPNEGYGTIMAEATAKNVITVGAAEGVRASGTDGCGVTNAGADSARDIIDFSSRGPTDDGRLKPDLVAPGTHITGARPRHGGYTGSGTCNSPFGGGFYSLISGSSQAAPQVSGAAALVRQLVQAHAGGRSLAGADQGAAREHRHRPRRRRQRQGRRDLGRAQHRPGLGTGQPGLDLRLHGARVPRPALRRRARPPRARACCAPTAPRTAASR